MKIVPSCVNFVLLECSIHVLSCGQHVLHRKSQVCSFEKAGMLKSNKYKLDL